MDLFRWRSAQLMNIQKDEGRIKVGEHFTYKNLPQSLTMETSWEWRFSCYISSSHTQLRRGGRGQLYNSMITWWTPQTKFSQLFKREECRDENWRRICGLVTANYTPTVYREICLCLERSQSSLTTPWVRCSVTFYLLMKIWRNHQTSTFNEGANLANLIQIMT